MRAQPFLMFAAILAGCTADAPPPYREVVTVKTGAAAAPSGSPPPGTVWRLDERDLQALSPAPYVEPPPPPRYPPPPRVEEPSPIYHAPPYYDPFWHGGYYGPYWGPGIFFHHHHRRR